ncbi:dihydroorotase [Rhodospirillum centenum]|uniref:Dihydroorotase-like protein n=1 Tax=Rhodospirillum centenum (strain ATCC 51521 / SW) TaxID=414684 RepID=B6IN32_RHOCS|nr:dihydroorotase [Rhodospirillum centenum]ACI98929.1 dihydroorotase-like protein [Rhodospirillum centenum SW]
MTTRTAYINARLLDPATGLDAPGALLVEGERIADLGPHLFADGVPEGVAVVDCGGHCLAPGLVDLRAHVGEPGFEHDETIATAGRAAAAGGITALAALPNTDPVIDDVAGLEFIARRAREERLVKIFAYAAVTRETAGSQITEFGLLAEAGAVGFTDGLHAVADALVMRRALSYASAHGQTIFQHPEEPRLASGSMNSGEVATRLGLGGIPAAAEIIMLERDLRLVELTGGRYHAAHISTAEGVEVIRRAKAKGLAVTCDTAPPYFALTEVDIGDYRTFFKLSPPLRGEMDRRAIVAGLADGTIDAIASDHLPHDQDSKRVPFAQAAFGAVGSETLLPLTLELAHKGALPLLRALAAVTCIPAGILGLSELGRLRPGGPADLVLFDAGRPWVVEAEKLRSKSKNTCFDRRPVQGLVLRTVVDGRTVHACA